MLAKKLRFINRNKRTWMTEAEFRREYDRATYNKSDKGCCIKFTETGGESDRRRVFYSDSKKCIYLKIMKNEKFFLKFLVFIDI